MTYDGRVMAAVVVPSGQTLSATTNAGTSPAVPLTAGTYASPIAWAAQLQVDLIAGRTVTGGTWQVSVSTGANGTGLCTIAVTNGTFSINFGSSDQYLLLGFDTNISATASATGIGQVKGLWMPDATLAIDGRYTAAPQVTDLRQTRSPAGLSLGHVGNVMYRHKNLRWTHVPMKRVWQLDELTENESLQIFMQDTQWGLGHSWFTPSSKCQIIAHDGSQIGGGAVAGWYLQNCAGMDDVVQRRGETWDGAWTVTFSEISTDS